MHPRIYNQCSGFNRNVQQGEFVVCWGGGARSSEDNDFVSETLFLGRTPKHETGSSGLFWIHKLTISPQTYWPAGMPYPHVFVRSFCLCITKFYGFVCIEILYHEKDGVNCGFGGFPEMCDHPEENNGVILGSGFSGKRQWWFSFGNAFDKSWCFKDACT